MVLISINPFVVRKIFLLAVALLGLSSAFCFADPVFMTQQYAPDRGQVRSAQSAQALVRNQDGRMLVGPSAEALTDRQGDVRSLAYLRLWDETNFEMHSPFSEVAPAFAGTPGCLRSEVRSNFSIIRPGERAGSF